jgi:predicted amidophosphoribosyltransferase
MSPNPPKPPMAACPNCGSSNEPDRRTCRNCQKPMSHGSGSVITLPPEWVAEKVRRTRAEQGLPPTVQDPVALVTAAELLRPLLERAATRQLAA